MPNRIQLAFVHDLIINNMNNNINSTVPYVVNRSISLANIDCYPR